VGSQTTNPCNVECVKAQGRRLFPELAGPLTFATVYHAYFRRVVSWMRAMRVPGTDMEDAAQEVFLIVQRKLPGFDGDNLAGWLYRIADLTARNYRRLAWFRHVFTRKRSYEADLWPMAGTPALTLEQKEDQRALAHMLARMSPKRRETLILFEVEGYSGQEIAALQGVPIKTVWTRLHHARKDLVAMVAAARMRREQDEGKQP
jgi:RNA polymerase sigma-70 factor, ECF subfamily